MSIFMIFMLIITQSCLTEGILHFTWGYHKPHKTRWMEVASVVYKVSHKLSESVV